jgi:hypothetical protein
MKLFTLAAVAFLALGSVAIAAERVNVISGPNTPTDANVPTGADVSGCTWRRIETGAQVCDPRSTENTLKDGTSAQAYDTVFVAGGGGGSNN